MENNPFLIVCAASSGSTLLSVLLDKHPDIACGPEIAVFNKKLTYKKYNTFQKKLPFALKSGTSSGGQVEYSGFFDNKKEYFQTEEDLIKLSKEALNTKKFFDLFFEKFLKKRNKIIWGEKTGSNSYYLFDFLKIYPNAKIIHLVRDPRDSINSIIKRTLNENTKDNNFAIYHSVSHWLYNNSAAYSIKNKKNYLRIKYENLVTNPEETLKVILEHIGVDYINLVNLDNNYWKEVNNENIHKTWNTNPFSKISTSSIGKYKEELPNEAFNMIKYLKLSFIARKKLKVKHKSIEFLMNEFGYENNKGEYKNANSKYLRKQILIYELQRAKREYRRHRIIYLPLFYV